MRGEAFYLPQHLFSFCDPKSFEVAIMELEEVTIQALHTLIWAHGLPYELLNSQYAYLLNEKAWELDTENTYLIPISIAQSVLYGLGMPIMAIGLPHPLLFASGLQSQMRKYNIDNAFAIKSAEMKQRQNPLHAQSPLNLIYPIRQRTS